MNRSRYKRASPNAAPASLRARLSSASSSSPSRASLIPRPPPPPAALTSSGYPISLRRLLCLGGRLDLLAGKDWDAGLGGLVAGPELVATQLDDLGRRADEREAVLARAAGQLGALGQEPVPGMDRVAVGPERGLHDEVVAQVALGGRRRPDAHRAVGAAGRQPVSVGIRRADHRLEPELLARVHDPQRDLAAIGDEHALDPPHAGSTRNSGSPYSTSSAFSAMTSAIVPDTPAGTEFIIFMTSMMQTIVSGSTRLPSSTNGG